MLHRFLAVAAILPLALCALPAQAQTRDSARVRASRAHAAHHDSAFAALQARGRLFMGVDQSTSVHRFDSLVDGGRIVLQRETDDAAGTATIRTHLADIAKAFAAGDFSTPFGVHAREVPGTPVMAELRARITYTFRPIERGGEVRIRTDDAAALAAIHEFLAFQRSDHRADGRVHHERRP